MEPSFHSFSSILSLLLEWIRVMVIYCEDQMYAKESSKSSSDGDLFVPGSLTQPNRNAPCRPMEAGQVLTNLPKCSLRHARNIRGQPSETHQRKPGRQAWQYHYTHNLLQNTSWSSTHQYCCHRRTTWERTKLAAR